MGTVRKLYDHFGLILTPQAEYAMQDYLNNDPKNKYGPHKYCLVEGSNLTEEDLKEIFSEYISLMAERVKMEEIL